MPGLHSPARCPRPEPRRQPNQINSTAPPWDGSGGDQRVFRCGGRAKSPSPPEFPHLHSTIAFVANPQQLPRPPVQASAIGGGGASGCGRAGGGAGGETGGGGLRLGGARASSCCPTSSRRVDRDLWLHCTQPSRPSTRSSPSASSESCRACNSGSSSRSATPTSPPPDRQGCKPFTF